MRNIILYGPLRGGVIMSWNDLHRVIHHGTGYRTFTDCKINDVGRVVSVVDWGRVTCKKCLRQKPKEVRYEGEG